MHRRPLASTLVRRHAIAFALRLALAIAVPSQKPIHPSILF